MRLGGGQLVSEELMNLGESFIQTNDPSLKLFQCAVCNKFTTDTLDLLGLHMNVERSLPEEEWKAVMGDSYQCKLCRYNTQLKANFQLHCKTDKHVQKYQLVAHIKEGGKANEWRLKCVAIGNPVHSLITSVCRQLVVLLPAAYLLSLTGKVNLVWLSYPIAELASGTATVFFFIRIYRQKIKPLFD